MNKDHSDPSFETLAIHAGEAPEPITGAQNTPIFQTATFELPDASEQVKQPGGQPGGYFYTREGNPTTAVFESKMATLDRAEDAVAAASGMGVIAAALLTVLSPGEHLVCSDRIYPISQDFITTELPRLGIDVSMVDITDLAAVESAFQPTTKAVLTESLSNPDLFIADLAGLRAITRKYDAALIIDNTFATPYLLRPLDYGADIVLHSATKYISGHGDTVAGVATGTRERIAKMRRFVARYGSPISPFNSWLLIRGVKTLPLRMDRHCSNAMELASFLVEHPAVAKVMYPGLPEHPGHALAKSMLSSRYGGMLAFEHVGGEAACHTFASHLSLACRAVSLGDVATLVLPWTGRNLVRVSVGIEGIEDLKADFAHALDQTQPAA
jgi:methionine-gamma-lyase